MELKLIKMEDGTGEYKVQGPNGRVYLRGTQRHAEYIFEQMQKAVAFMETIPCDARDKVLDGLARFY